MPDDQLVIFSNSQRNQLIDEQNSQISSFSRSDRFADFPNRQHHALLYIV
jgi:hypothetical protein